MYLPIDIFVFVTTIRPNDRQTHILPSFMLYSVQTQIHNGGRPQGGGLLVDSVVGGQDNRGDQQLVHELVALSSNCT